MESRRSRLANEKCMAMLEMHPLTFLAILIALPLHSEQNLDTSEHESSARCLLHDVVLGPDVPGYRAQDPQDLLAPA